MVPAPGGGRPPTAKPLPPRAPHRTGCDAADAATIFELGGIGMTTGVAKLRNVVGALVLLAVTVVSPLAMAQQPKSVDPTASAVSEQQLLQQFKTIQGRGSIPDTKSYTIEQPAGRD